VDVFFGALNASFEVRYFHVLLSGLLDQTRRMVGVGAVGVHSEGHYLDLHDNLVLTDGTLLGTL